ncbi:hypothetical protein RchiOBHm_Chr4g0385571 [Rosa chinensis]|uniref:Uncharacterized protein n=1 Tax=Rosa chinensis TaxID=74649 RepID=A0A2P6QNZ1_ROSCH|nr:hypothetical protein RchiOBHm_Chr4g0385571 [Rosa chinensis]
MSKATTLESFGSIPQIRELQKPRVIKRTETIETELLLKQIIDNSTLFSFFFESVLCQENPIRIEAPRVLQYRELE